jgi:hypothetical protein
MRSAQVAMGNEEKCVAFFSFFLHFPLDKTFFSCYSFLGMVASTVDFLWGRIT